MLLNIYNYYLINLNITNKILLFELGSFDYLNSLDKRIPFVNYIH